MPRLRRLLVALALPAATAAAQGPVVDPCQEGRRLYLENDYLAAEPLLVDCLQRDESLLALLPLAMIAVLQQRTEEGLAYGSRALVLAPDNVNVRYWYGRALMQDGRIDQALEQWELAMSLDAGHVGVLEGLARLNLSQGRPDRAYNLLRQMRLQGVDEIWLHRLLTDLARRQGYWDLAASHWRDVIAREGATEANLLMQGELAILAGRSDEAVEIFRRAIVDQPTAALYGGLGEALFTADRIDSAAVALEQAVALDPENPRHRFNLANALELLERSEEAGRHFRVYLEQRPDDPVGRFHHAVHLMHRDRNEAAAAELEEAVRLDPGYVQARVVLAQVYEELGRTVDALAQVDELGRLDPGSAAELAEWRLLLQDDLAAAAGPLAAGKVHLLHIVVADQEAATTVRRELDAGADFAAVAVRLSQGPTAVRGGDIGWVDPAGMVPALREAIVRLAPGETSPPVETGGQVHVLKRIR